MARARQSLGDAVERVMLAPFVWGRCDCLTAVADALIAMGRPDIAAPFRGIYSDEAGARMVGRVEARAAERFAELGWPEIDPESARDGDVGVVGNCLAIRLGDRWAVKSEDGLIAKRRVRRAWRTP